MAIAKHKHKKAKLKPRRQCINPCHSRKPDAQVPLGCPSKEAPTITPTVRLRQARPLAGVKTGPQIVPSPGESEQSQMAGLKPNLIKRLTDFSDVLQETKV